MQIELIEATHANRPVLAALFELYLYDFSEFTHEDVGDDGRFGARFLHRYFDADETRRALLLRIDGKWAGLTLLHRGAFLVHDDEAMDIVEFFVMRKYRRRGAGETMARAIFDRFPGRWEVRVMADNVSAQAFWRKTVSRYTGDRFEERIWDDDRWAGIVQFFDSREHGK